MMARYLFLLYIYVRLCVYKPLFDFHENHRKVNYKCDIKNNNSNQCRTVRWSGVGQYAYTSCVIIISILTEKLRALMSSYDTGERGVLRESSELTWRFYTANSNTFYHIHNVYKCCLSF